MRGVTSNTSWAQAFSQGRIIEVALGLIEVANCVALRHGAVAQAGNLRENESHSVGPLVGRGSVLRRPGRTGSLRLHEANEIRIGHEGSVGSWHALISAPKMAKICDYPAASYCSEAENGRTAAVTLCRLPEIAGG